MKPFDFGIGRTIPPQYGNLDTRLHIPDRGDMPSAGPHHRKTHLQHTPGIARSYPVAEPRQLLPLRLQQLRTAQSQNTLHRIEILRTGSQVVTRRLRKPNVQVAQIRQATVNRSAVSSHRAIAPTAVADHASGLRIPFSTSRPPGVTAAGCYRAVSAPRRKVRPAAPPTSRRRPPPPP